MVYSVSDLGTRMDLMLLTTDLSYIYIKICLALDLLILFPLNASRLLPRI